MSKPLEIETWQVRKIRTLARKIFTDWMSVEVDGKQTVDSEQYREFLAQWGVQHTKDLSRQQAMDVIAALSGEGMNRNTMRALGGHKATQRQLDAIAYYEDKLGWIGEAFRLAGMVRKVCHVNCDQNRVYKIIPTLSRVRAGVLTHCLREIAIKQGKIKA